MRDFLKLYIDAYRGLSRPSWMLALVMLINRSGAMVIPFLGVYMVNDLHFSLENTGIVLSCFGAGAVLGSLLGGWLTDKVGHFKVQVVSLLLTAPMFLVLPQLKTVFALGIGVFVLSIFSETFRPANSVSVASYAKPENVIRAFSLNRMAVNLGFSIGPALGGFLAAISYSFLFYGNAIAAFCSFVLFYAYFKNLKGQKLNKSSDSTDEARAGADRSPYRDLHFMIFSALCTVYAICFFQFLSTLPLYYRTDYKLSEYGIGIILAFSGAVVFSLEMLLVHIAERRMTTKGIMVLGTLLCAVSFLILNMVESVFILYVSMFFLCVSEILVMPFMATVTMKRSSIKKRGAYMAVNALTFSIAHIFSPYIGTKVAAEFGFATLWWGITATLVVTSIGFFLVMKKIN